MKYINKIISLIVLFMVFIPFVYADSLEENNLVNIYLFYKDGCTYCSSEKKVLDEIDKIYDNVKIYTYEVGSNENNLELMREVAKLYNIKLNGVPFTVIANKAYSGFDIEESKRVFLGTVEYYSKNGYEDIVGKYLGNVELPVYEIIDDSNFYEYIESYGVYELSLFGIKINTNKIGLSISSMIIGIIDSINSCWIILLMTAVFISIKDRKIKWYIGLIYICLFSFSCLLYLLFNLRIYSNIVRYILGSIILFISFYNIYKNFSVNKDNNFLEFISAIILVIFVSVINIYFFSKSDTIILDVLSINNITMIERLIYIFTYILFYILDDFIVLFVINNNNISKMFRKIGIIFLLVIGLFLIFKPMWLI